MKSKSSPIAITGIGVVCPLGNDTQSAWQNLLAGKSGIDHIQQFDASQFPCRVAAEVRGFDLATFVKNKKISKYAVIFSQYALAAAEQAFVDADIRPQASNAQRWGVVTGSGMMTAEYEYWQRFHGAFVDQGAVDFKKFAHAPSRFFRTADFGKTTPNSGLALLLKQYQILGYSNAVHTACASGGQALGMALQAIRRGEVDCMLAGGFDSMVNPFGLSSFCLLGALSDHNDPPAQASRPFDYTRNGFVLGEGAAFLVLEKWQHAVARKAKIYAELAGEGNSLSCYRITDSHPSGDGAIQAIRGALSDAGENGHNVDYINAHGTSTKMNDLSETNAIKAVFGDKAKKIPISATKSQTGHLIAGAGALEAAFTALAIHHGKLPMTRNLTTPDPECDLDYVTDQVRDKNIQVAMSNSFGFGGSNSCLLFRHPDKVEGIL